MDQQIKNPPPMQETQEMRVQSLGREDALERGTAIAPVFLREQSHGRGDWRATAQRYVVKHSRSNR